MKTEWTLKEMSNWTRIDSEVKIPAIQRGLVWKPYQVELLWDSILLPTINILQETIDNESEEKGEAGALSDIEILFNRIGTGGTPITQSELMYSAVKAYWPELSKRTIGWQHSTCLRIR